MFDCLKREVYYKTSRSSGPGGQHVNKTESRVELYWDMPGSKCLNEEQKLLLGKRLSSRITDKGNLVLSCEAHRSQHRNKEEVTARFMALITANLVPQKKRRPTKPSRSSIEKRLQDKKYRSQLKKNRRDNLDS